MIENSKYPAKFKYLYMAQWIVIATVFWLTFRFVAQIEFTIWEALILFADTALIMALIYVIPLQKKEKAQEEARGVDFFDGPISENKTKKEPFFLGFRRHKRIYIDWTEDDSLGEMLKSTMYKNYLRELLKDKAVDEFFKRSKSQKEEKDFIKSLEKEQFSIQTSITEDGKFDKEKIKKDTKKLEIKAKEIIKAKKKLIPYNEFKIEEITDDDKAILKGMYIYYVEMYDIERFEDEKKGWNKCLIILPEPYEKLLKCEPSLGWYNGWRIGLNSVNVFWLKLFQVTSNMPALYLRFSDNFPEEEIDKLEKLRALSLTYLQLKVLQKWVYHLATIPERIQSENVRLEAKANSFREGFSYMIQDFANDNLIFSKFVKDMVQDKLKGQVAKYKKRYQLLISILLALGIGFLIILIIFFTTTANTGADVGDLII